MYALFKKKHAYKTGRFSICIIIMMHLLGRMVQTGMFVVDVGRRVSPNKPVSKADAQWLKGRIQGMGPTYIKIGQFMSARRDIFDREVCEALKELQDNVPPIEEAQAAALLDKVRPRMRELNAAPIASASIGQVHTGRLKRRKSPRCVVKVKRPGIADAIQADIDVLLVICDLLKAAGVEHVAESRAIVTEFREFILQESDFVREAANMRAFAESVAGDPAVIVPQLVGGLCDADAIVMQYVPSVKFKVAKARMDPAARRAVAYGLMDLFVTQLVTTGVVHGDPHEGNIALSPDFSRYVFYDFGNMIVLDKVMRQQLKRLVFELMTDNVDATIDVLRGMPYVSVRDEGSLRAYISKYSEYMKTVDVKVFQGMIDTDKDTFTKLPVKFDAVIFRIIRVFGLVEGICKDLDPTFNYVDVFVKHADTVFADVDFIDYKIRSDLRLLLKNIGLGYT